MAAPRPLRIGSLFSGSLGLDMAVSQLWPNAEHVWTCETDAAASEIIATRMPGVPNYGDVTKVDWSTVPEVDILVGGFPCQDISHAGKQAGIKEGTRSGLWFNFAEAIRVLRPKYVYLENVAAIAYKNGPLDTVLGSLAAIGFDAEWGLLRASEVGACHQRRRWFCLAWPADSDGIGAQVPAARRQSAIELSRGEGSNWEASSRVELATGLTTLPTPVVNDMGRGKELGWWEDWITAMKAKHGNGNGNGKSLSIEVRKVAAKPLANNGLVSIDAWGQCAPAITQHANIYGADHPPPTDGQSRLSPEFVEWMMFWPIGWTDVGLSRSKRLQKIGDGVVPLQAVHAFRQLHDRQQQGYQQGAAT